MLELRLELVMRLAGGSFDSGELEQGVFAFSLIRAPRAGGGRFRFRLRGQK